VIDSDNILFLFLSKLLAMKKQMTFLACVALCFQSYAQNTYPWPNSGNVGVGTASPNGRLQVGATGSTTAAEGLYLGGADAYLYRSGVNMISTPANITAGRIAIGSNANLAGNQLYMNGGASSVLEIDLNSGGYSRTVFAENNTAKYLIGYNQSGDTKLGIYDYGSGTWSTTWYNGNVGINATSPSARLQVGDLVSGTESLLIGNTGGFIAQNTSGTNYALSYTSADKLNFGFNTMITAPVAPVMTLLSNGNVGIGTTDPQGYKLAVNGTAIAESMKIKLHGAWPDYVFSPDHRVLSLGELATYVSTHRHLPEVPVAAEVEKDGIDLGRMNKILLQKIEELTLYLIEQNKAITEQKKEIRQLNNRLSQLEKK
jgi:hypothetical protein